MLYDALRVLLVEEGPLENLFSSRLPAEQVGVPVDTAFTFRKVGAILRGTWAATPVMDGPAGVMHDGGVLVE